MNNRNDHRQEPARLQALRELHELQRALQDPTVPCGTDDAIAERVEYLEEKLS